MEEKKELISYNQLWEILDCDAKEAARFERRIQIGIGLMAFLIVGGMISVLLIFLIPFLFSQSKYIFWSWIPGTIGGFVSFFCFLILLKFLPNKFSAAIYKLTPFMIWPF